MLNKCEWYLQNTTNSAYLYEAINAWGKELEYMTLTCIAPSPTFCHCMQICDIHYKSVTFGFFWGIPISYLLLAVILWDSHSYKKACLQCMQLSSRWLWWRHNYKWASDMPMCLWGPCGQRLHLDCSLTCDKLTDDNHNIFIIQYINPHLNTMDSK